MKMKSSVLAIGLVVLTMAILAQSQVRRTAPAKGAAEAEYRISSPYVYKNLTVFLIYGQDKIAGKRWLTLQEALVQRKVIVYETTEVNELAIRNVSSEEVYVQAGEIVKGGKQDRMLGVDLIVPPHSGKIPIAAFCVESGRWTRRGGEEAGLFSSSADAVVSRDLKIAAKVANSQGEVWKNVAVSQDKLSAIVGSRVNAAESESSLQLAVENRRVQATADHYIKELSHIIYSKNNVIGYAFAINGNLNSADVYASSALFYKLWSKLLKASAIEAMAELRKDQKYEPATSDQVRTFFSDSQAARPVEKEVSTRVGLVTRESTDNVFFETRDRAQKDAWVHRNYIKKN
jgi:hypothetical protein